MCNSIILERPGTTKAVLLIHGICSGPHHFDWLLPSFDESWSVYNILLDGHGASARDFGRSSMKKWKAQTRQMLDKLCAQYETVILVGYSMGTLLELYALGDYPRVKGMLLMNVPTYLRFSASMPGRYVRLALGRSRQDDPHEAGFAADSSIAVTWKLWAYIPWPLRMLELIALGKDCRSLVSQISVPTYAYFGKKDELVSLRSAKAFQSNPRVTVRIMEQAGHFWYPDADKQKLFADLAVLMKTIENDK